MCKRVAQRDVHSSPHSLGRFQPLQPPQTKTLPPFRNQQKAQHKNEQQHQQLVVLLSNISTRERESPPIYAAHVHRAFCTRRQHQAQLLTHFENLSRILEGRGLSLTVSLQWSASGSSFQPGQVCDVGVPTVSKMRLSWSDSFLPGKTEDLVNSSATMQPTDHRSTAGPYCRGGGGGRREADKLGETPLEGSSKVNVGEGEYLRDLARKHAGDTEGGTLGQTSESDVPFKSLAHIVQDRLAGQPSRSRFR